MNHTVFIFFLITLAACSSTARKEQSEKNEIQQETNGKDTASFVSESFDQFYEKFKSDSVYQVSRIVFPLPVETYDTDVEGVVKSAIDEKEWGFMSFNEKRYILKVESAADTTKVNIQIEDTGVFVDYLFTLVDNKWKLVKVVDQST